MSFIATFLPFFMPEWQHHKIRNWMQNWFCGENELKQKIQNTDLAFILQLRNNTLARRLKFVEKIKSNSKCSNNNSQLFHEMCKICLLIIINIDYRYRGYMCCKRSYYSWNDDSLCSTLFSLPFAVIVIVKLENIYTHFGCVHPYIAINVYSVYKHNEWQVSVQIHVWHNICLECNKP